MVTVYLAKALICFSSMCHPVLIGEDTRPGTYPLHHIYVSQPGYGGDVIMYSRKGKLILSIHRVWEGKPSEKRRERLHGPTEKRKGITKGCINVDETVYDALVDCCSVGTLEIKE